MELEPKHLTPYLCHGLQMQTSGGAIFRLIVDHADADFENASIGTTMMMVKNGTNARPVLRPLSQITEEITHNGKTFVPIDFLDMYPEDLRIIIKHGAIEANMNWHDAQKLFEWHFDAFGLIDSGLAIEKPKH